jgi:ADP-glucose pyrophosphorylase
LLLEWWPAGGSYACKPMPLMRKAIAVLMAGGQGERLWPLTRDRAKPAVPFGGVYRIIDVTLSG